jgi:hypothetical protein
VSVAVLACGCLHQQSGTNGVTPSSAKPKVPAASSGGGSRNPLQVVAWIVQAQLEKFFVVGEDVSVSIIRTGKAQLFSISLKADALNGLKLPLRITRSFAREVKLSFPNFLSIIKKLWSHQDIKLTVEISDIERPWVWVASACLFAVCRCGWGGGGGRV